MEYLKRSIPRTAQELRSVSEQVAAIIQNVREKGDRAILEYNTQFDKNTREQFRVTPEEIQAAYAQLTEQEIADLKEAASNIRTFAEAQLQCMKPLDNFSVIPGSSLGHRVIPVSSCGCYVPGGSYPLFSTALMLIIPAKVAGVKRVAACSPAVKGTGYINAKTLVAMDIAGADEIYVTGGAHGIAAYAYGTDQIKPVDVIVGPGNQYVAEAKRQCYGQVGIDFFAGPSEVLVLADESADPEVLAADLLAQSEHDKMAKGILVTTSRELGEAVIKAVEQELQFLDTEEIARVSWDNHGEVILVNDMHEIVDMATDLNIIEKSGSWFSYQGDRLGQGRDKVVDLLKENPDLADELESKIMDTVKQQGADAVAKAVSASDPSEDEDLGLPIVSED